MEIVLFTVDFLRILYSLGVCGLLCLLIQAVFFHHERSNSSSSRGMSAVVSWWPWPSSHIVQRRKLKRQGIDGPPPSSLFYGNAPEMQEIVRSAATAAAAAKSFRHSGDAIGAISHDYTASIFPYFEHWAQKYGQVYTYSMGCRQHLYVGDPEIVRELNQTMTLSFGKPVYMTKELGPMLGNGVLRANGQLWARQRKIIAPEFFMDRVKTMTGLMREACHIMLAKWDKSIDANQGGDAMVEVRVDEDLRTLSADVISRCCFGSSYSKGKEIFSKLRTLQIIFAKRGFLFRNRSSFSFKFMKSSVQRELERLEKEVETLIWEVVQERIHKHSKMDSGNEDEHHEVKDLLQMILDGAIREGETVQSAKHFIIDNCKNIYFAGHETTAISASWCLVLLAVHTEWQDRLRSEITSSIITHGQDSLDIDALLKNKTMTMFINEVLRLYNPAAFVIREALDDFKLGSIMIPKGVCLWTLIPSLHRDVKVWGSDANEFKPERFADGVSNACKVPQAYVPFGAGPRVCVGKNLAMLELKLIVSQFISKFRFELSPRYEHKPAYRMVIEPGMGVYLNIRRVDRGVSSG